MQAPQACHGARRKAKIPGNGFVSARAGRPQQSKTSIASSSLVM
jgi:hypothetical protein